MKPSIWYKYMFNIGLNQTTAVQRLTYAAFQKGTSGEIKEAMEIFEKAMREVIAAANAEGIDLNESDIDSTYKVIDTLSPDGLTSMYQDVLAGRKTEAEMFSPVLMGIAKKHGIATPVNEILYLQLRIIEKQMGK